MFYWGVVHFQSGTRNERVNMKVKILILQTEYPTYNFAMTNCLAQFVLLQITHIQQYFMVRPLALNFIRK